ANGLLLQMACCCKWPAAANGLLLQMACCCKWPAAANGLLQMAQIGLPKTTCECVDDGNRRDKQIMP
ncbi:MAG: hypothetical protein GY822_21440, partial [Deltaproteobacteria bacterium]|nr:hypothetical protein [Deltaproteobacteria bacterium]